MSNKKVIVIGAGAAGLMAAGWAGENGALVTLLEKTDFAGKKILLTGGGRCNLTNTGSISDFLKMYRPDGRFLRQAFSNFSNKQTVEFFKELGVETVEEAGGKIYTKSGKAKDIVDALIRFLTKNKAELKINSGVKKILTEDKKVKGVQLSNGTVLDADSVIITTGGSSYPSTGSSGDGFKMAQELGHKIVPIRPALVGFEIDGDYVKTLAGVSLSDIKLKLIANSKKVNEKTGEMLFTHWGISGPAVLSLSGYVVDEMDKGVKTELAIDFLIKLDEKALDEKLVKEFEAKGKQQIKNLVKDFVPLKLAEVMLDLAGIKADKLCSQINGEERKKLRTMLKDFRLQIKSNRGLREAMVTAGGVELSEIDPNTMQSKIIQGLYFAGEVINIDGDSGGYNLQAAFSTAKLAATSAAS